MPNKIVWIACLLIFAAASCADPGGSGTKTQSDGSSSDTGTTTDTYVSDIPSSDLTGVDQSLDTSVQDATQVDSTSFDTSQPELPPPQPPGTVAGIVWAPGSAPGMVPPGQEIPVSGADVYVSTNKPDDIPQHAYCELCVPLPVSGVETDAKGHFSVSNDPGTYWLIIKKGQFRIEQQVTLAPNLTLTLTQAQTTLPKSHDPANGRWTPRIAVAVGNYDHLEDIFGKIGMGSVNGSGDFNPSSATGYFDVWYNGGSGFDAISKGNLDTLVGSLSLMQQYHIIIIPCAAGNFTGALQSPAVLKNIRDYVASGGKLYVTDWSGEWHDNVFPSAITLEPSEDTPPNAYNFAANTWNPSLFGDADGSPYETPNGEATDPDLFAWLNGQQGPTISSSSTSSYNAGNFEVEGNWNTIESVGQVQIGTGVGGAAIYNTPHVYVKGGKDIAPTPKYPLTVTYEPTGCGRVLYSTYHTTDTTHVGLVPQERVLLYLIMEIGTCQDLT